MTLAFALSPVLGLAVFLVPSGLVALWLNAPLSFVMAMWLPAYYTSHQELADPRYRATASAFGLIFFNLIGTGMGPLVVGRLSDWFSSWAGGTALRYALAANLIFALWGLLHIRLAARTMAADVATARK
jgi:hypothetical protein